MFPTRFGMKECGNDLEASQEREVIVSVIPNLPVRGLPVTVTINSDGIPQQSGICVKGEGLESCTIQIMSHHSADRPLSFKLRTVCNTAQTADSTVQFKFQAVAYDTIQNPFWIGYKFPTIEVGYNKLYYIIFVFAIIKLVIFGREILNPQLTYRSNS